MNLRFLPVAALWLSLTSLVTATDPSATPGTPKVRNVTPDQAEKALQEHKGIVVLNVRTPEEFNAGHIAGAINLNANASDFQAKLGTLDKEKEYIVHCAAGGRSTRAVGVMKDQHFKDILHLNGGMNAWTAAGKTVVTGPAAPALAPAPRQPE